MFSGSNSYLGGANSGRPGHLQPQPTGFQGQPSPFQSQQPTGFGQQQQQPLQQQYTGYPAGGLQPQVTGYPQNQQQYQGFQQPQPTGYQPPQQQQPQQTGYPGQQQQNGAPPPAPPQMPQPTGMTSNDIAASFRGTAQPSPQPAASRGSKIPNMRLSFITAGDQAKFEQLFKSATGNEQALSGDKARDLLLRSKLDGNSLAQIWTLADTTKSGQLLFPEFALAMWLCNLSLTGKSMPATLSPSECQTSLQATELISWDHPNHQLRPSNNLRRKTHPTLSSCRN
jgi:hypothetical protein